MAKNWPDPLPCGRELDELVIQVADGQAGDTDHQRTCAHCQRALATLHELWDVVDDLANERVRASGSIDRAAVRRVRRDIFVARAIETFGGILPRLSRALLIYAGILVEDRT